MHSPGVEHPSLRALEEKILVKAPASMFETLGLISNLIPFSAGSNHPSPQRLPPAPFNWRGSMWSFPSRVFISSLIS